MQLKYGPRFKDDMERASKAGQRLATQMREIWTAEDVAKHADEVCIGAPDGKHKLDDGRCLYCPLDLEYTSRR